jgi:hypothetical protein
MFLGINALSVKGEKDSFSIIFEDNPLNDFVELPSGLEDLWYSNVLAGKTFQLPLRRHPRCARDGANEGGGQVCPGPAARRRH